MKGQTLIEVLLALGTAVVVLSATVVAVLSALNNAQFSKNQSIATQYTQQGMEVMRKMRNSKWSEFDSIGTESYCLDKNEIILLPTPRVSTPGCARTGGALGNNVDNFARQVDIEKNSPSCESPLPCSFEFTDTDCDLNNDRTIDEGDNTRWRSCTQVSGTPPRCSFRSGCDLDNDGGADVADSDKWTDCLATPTPPPINVTRVTVSVSWSSNKCTRGNIYCHNVKLVSCLGSP